MNYRRVGYETARLRLSRYRMEGEQARTRAAQHATQVSAEALAVERVGVWLLGTRGEQLVCASQYSRTRKEHGSGQVLRARDYPTYLGALMERRIIAADDAREHALTRELARDYLEPAGITSMLDAPIIREGRVVGVVCHEHVGPARVWTDKELAFASSVADMVTLIFEQADRLELEAALQERAEQRQESDKMEALGRLACAVAHDSNNVLAAISIGLELFTRSATGALKETAREISQMIAAGQRLNRQLLEFGRHRSDTAPTDVELRALVDGMLPMLRTSAGRSIALELRVSTEETRVRGDASQLEQVLLNLTLNARDAIAGNGAIQIELRDARPEDDVAPDYLVLEVRDNGAGMDETTREHVFEPFFSTKKSGSGLGLATVYGVVKRCGGVVRASSQLGVGTVMLVALPRALEG